MIILDQNLFYDIIILLLHEHSDVLRNLAYEFINLYKENENNLIDNERKIISIYVQILQDILENKLTFDQSKELNIILSKYKTNSIVSENEDLYKNIENIISNNISEELLNNIKSRLNSILLWYKLNENVNKLKIYLSKFRQTVDDEQRNNIFEVINSYIDNLNIIKSSNYLDDGRIKGTESINLRRKEDIKIAVEEFKKIKITNTVKLGLKGLNSMNHPYNGFSLGDSIVFAALSHHFKSSMLLNITRWLIEYNDFTNLYKSPVILFISLENKANMNLMWLFKRFYYNQHKDDPGIFEKMNQLSDEEIVNFLYDYLSKKDTTLIIERFRPDEFGFENLVKLCTKYENSGFKVVSLIIDYLSLMKKNSSTLNSNMGTPLAIQELYRKVCNFVKDMNIILFTAHQLNRDAARLATQVEVPVKRFDSTHLAYSSDVEREVDILIFNHIERLANGQSFLTMKLHKNRYNPDIPDKYKFVAYELHKDIGLIDDIDTKFAGERNFHKIIEQANASYIDSSDW